MMHATIILRRSLIAPNTTNSAWSSLLPRSICRHFSSLPTTTTTTFVSTREHHVNRILPSTSSLSLSSSLLPTQSVKSHFSSAAGNETMTAASDALMDLIQREYDEEVANESTKMPESLKDLVEILTGPVTPEDPWGGWKIVNDDTVAMTKLYKTIEPDNVKVQVCFHCQDETEGMANEEEEEYQDDQEPAEEQEEHAASVRFTVSVTKQGKTMFMVCVAEDSTVRIQNVAMAGTAVEDMDALHANGVKNHLYQGPEFTELAEDVQDAFANYVDQYLGINHNVAAYIGMQFDYKEQCQYVQFLKDTKSMLG